VPNKESVSKTNDSWTESKEKNHKVVINNDKNKFTHSIISDIFGGLIRTEFHVDGSRNHSVNLDPCFVLSLPIIGEQCSIEDCLDQYFKQQAVEGYQLKGKTVRAF